MEREEELAAVAGSWSAETACTEQLRHQDTEALLTQVEPSGLPAVAATGAPRPPEDDGPRRG